MTKATTYSVTGKKASDSTTLPASVFGEKDGSVSTIKQVLEAYQANGRTINASTKTKGLVRGGGRKPWKQKGTGRARAGSIRSPLWRGGGITFGPLSNRNFTKKVNSKMKSKAIRQSLTMKAAEKKVVVVKDLDKLDGKTKSLATLLSGVGADRRTVILTENVSEAVQKSASNISGTTIKQAAYVNIHDAVNSDMIIIDEKALKPLESALKAGK